MTAPIVLDLDAIEAALKPHISRIFKAMVPTDPEMVLELVRRLRAAEALSASRIEQIPIDSKVVAVFHDVRPEQLAEAEAFAEAIKKRCTSGQWTLVAFFPIGTDIQALDKDQMLQAGWVRQPKIADRKASVDADALRQVLQALAGPAHHIRELQVCRGLPDSPIEKLIAEFNAQMADHCGSQANGGSK